MRSHRVLLLAVVVLAAGCGSTAPRADVLGASQDDLGAAAPVGSGAPGAVASGGPTGPSASDAAAAATTGSHLGALGKAAPAAAAAAAPASDAAVRRGVSGATVTIGVSYLANTKAVNDAMGASNIPAGDDRAYAQILINDLNRQGGLAGREIVPVFRAGDAQSTEPYATQGQKTCAFFTQDNHVFAVFSESPIDVFAIDCLNNAGVPVIKTSVIAGFDSTRGKYGLDVNVTGMNIDRSFEGMLNAFRSQGWYGGWDPGAGAAVPTKPKVGILTLDDPQFNFAVDHVLIPGLRAAGAAPATEDVIRLGNTSSQADTGGLVAAIQSAVLKFRADGVDHVIITDTSGGVTLFFLKNADSQHYFPRYGGSSANGFQILLTSGNISAASVNGAVIAGWAPGLDLPTTADVQAPYLTPAAKRCYLLMKQNQQPQNPSQLAYCDQFWLLRRALGSVNAVTRSAFVTGFEGMGSSFDAASALATRFGAGRHDGNSGYYASVYDAGGCGCFVYRGTRQSV